MSLFPFNLANALTVVVAVALLTGAWLVFDAIGDAREAKVWAKVNSTIDAANEETDEANAEDAEARALRQKLRAKALLTSTTVIKTECKLTADEAVAIGAVR